MELFWIIHRHIPREGPGTEKATKEVLAIIKNRKAEIQSILDVGCGPGTQTMVLSENTNAHIKAVDKHQPFLDVLDKKAVESGNSGRIEIINASMFDMPFSGEEFDLIWSEGAIYIIGFEEGITAWKGLLKDDGFLAASEISWLCQRELVPEECRNFWEEAYPKIGTVTDNIQKILKAGYRYIGSLVLPEEGWWEYYGPLQKNIEKLSEENKNNNEVQAFILEEIKEIEMYRKYKDFYGYVFYIMQKN